MRTLQISTSNNFANAGPIKNSKCFEIRMMISMLMNFHGFWSRSDI